VVGWTQLEAEEKMRLGVEEYKQKLATELDTVSRQLASERKKQQALEVYRDKVRRLPSLPAHSCLLLSILAEPGRLSTLARAGGIPLR
jgi:hypothetical protein